MSFSYASTAEYSAYFVGTTFMLGNSLWRMDAANSSPIVDLLRVRRFLGNKVLGR